MFQISRVNVIDSESGFSVEILGRTGIEYRESDRAMFIESEILMTNVPTVAIWKDQIRAWKPPHDRERVDDGKRNEMRFTSSFPNAVADA